MGIDKTAKSYFLFKTMKQIFGPYEDYLNGRIERMAIANGNDVGFVVGNLSFVTKAGKFSLTLKPELVEEAKALDEIRYKLKRDSNAFTTYFSSAISKAENLADVKASLPPITHAWFDTEMCQGISLNIADSAFKCPPHIEKLITLYIMYRMVV